jgi:hypothetical protein
MGLLVGDRVPLAQISPLTGSPAPNSSFICLP